MKYPYTLNCTWRYCKYRKYSIQIYSVCSTVYGYINTSISINCIYFLPCFCFDTNILNMFVFMFGMYLVQYLLWKSKDTVNCIWTPIPLRICKHLLQDNLVKFCNFYPHLNLETVFPALKLTQIYCMDMNISFLENWQFLNHKLAPSLLLTYQAWKSNLTTWQNMKVSGIWKFPFSNSIVNWQKFGNAA